MNGHHQQIVETFPSPYDSNATEYKVLTFDSEIRDFCENEEFDGKAQLRIAKCILVGDIAVGKTSLVNRCSYDVFSSDYKATIGVDFDVQHFSILGIPFSLQIWDTAGQERFKSIATSYYRGTHVVIVVFDMSNINSLSNAEVWLDDVLSSNKDVRPLVFLVGSKMDTVPESVRDEMETAGKDMAKKLKAEYWSVSAQTGENVEELFARVAVLTFQEMSWREIEGDPTVRSSQVSNSVTLYSGNLLALDKHDPRTSCFGINCY